MKIRIGNGVNGVKSVGSWLAAGEVDARSAAVTGSDARRPLRKWENYCSEQCVGTHRARFRAGKLIKDQGIEITPLITAAECALDTLEKILEMGLQVLLLS